MIDVPAPPRHRTTQTADGSPGQRWPLATCERRQPAQGEAIATIALGLPLAIGLSLGGPGLG